MSTRLLLKKIVNFVWDVIKHDILGQKAEFMTLPEPIEIPQIEKSPELTEEQRRTINQCIDPNNPKKIADINLYRSLSFRHRFEVAHEQSQRILKLEKTLVDAKRRELGYLTSDEPGYSPLSKSPRKVESSKKNEPTYEDRLKEIDQEILPSVRAMIEPYRERHGDDYFFSLPRFKLRPQPLTREEKALAERKRREQGFKENHCRPMIDVRNASTARRNRRVTFEDCCMTSNARRISLELKRQREQLEKELEPIQEKFSLKTEAERNPLYARMLRRNRQRQLNQPNAHHVEKYYGFGGEVEEPPVLYRRSYIGQKRPLSGPIWWHRPLKKQKRSEHIWRGRRYFGRKRKCTDFEPSMFPQETKKPRMHECLTSPFEEGRRHVERENSIF